MSETATAAKVGVSSSPAMLLEHGIDATLLELAQIRARVEHPFRIVKRVFGYVKVRFKGLAKNTAQVVTLFALANLYLARKRLLPTTGQLRLQPA